MNKLEGKIFGKWTVISFSGKKNKALHWNCICECGKEKIIRAGTLTQGRTSSCMGCSKRTHGLNNHPLYKTVNNAIQRCNNPKHPDFHNYGGRGIRFKFNSIPEAIKWIEENLGPRPKGMELDRINNDGHYEADIKQLRWASKTIQMTNRRYKSSTGYRGVRAQGKSFIAKIGYNGKTHHIGTFSNPKLASLAYESCKEVLYTSEAQ